MLLSAEAKDSLFSVKNSKHLDAYNKKEMVNSRFINHDQESNVPHHVEP